MLLLLSFFFTMSSEPAEPTFEIECDDCVIVAPVSSTPSVAG